MTDLKMFINYLHRQKYSEIRQWNIKMQKVCECKWACLNITQSPTGMLQGQVNSQDDKKKIAFHFSKTNSSVSTWLIAGWGGRIF